MNYELEALRNVKTSLLANKIANQVSLDLIDSQIAELTDGDPK